MQPFIVVIINKYNAHLRLKTSVTFLHWHAALRLRLLSRVVNPGNPAIKRHVVRRLEPRIALENKIVKEKKRKSPGKDGFLFRASPEITDFLG